MNRLWKTADGFPPQGWKRRRTFALLFYACGLSMIAGCGAKNASTPGAAPKDQVAIEAMKQRAEQQGAAMQAEQAKLAAQQRK